MQHFMSYEKKTNSFNTSSNSTPNSTPNNTPNNNNEDVLKQFPKIKFSYESKPYKKVSQNNKSQSDSDSNNSNNNEIYFIIPKGKKYFVWFKNNECFFLELDAQRKIVTITKKTVSHAFPNNTILYGTHFYIRKIKNHQEHFDTTYYFTIENIHYYNGLHLDTTSVFEKFKKINDFFKQQQQLNSQKQHSAVEIGLPHISSSLKGASDIKPVYSAFCIQKRYCKNVSNEYENIFYFNSLATQSYAPLRAPSHAPLHAPLLPTNKINNNNNNNNGNHGKYKFFMVKADIQNDIYHLSNPDGSGSGANVNNVNTNANIENELIASIPDYKTSVMMNSLFRNIKENKSLDALEESDDEDEFENVNINKFVDLSKKIKMKCVYNHKFKKWTPIAPINE